MAVGFVVYRNGKFIGKEFGTADEVDQWVKEQAYPYIAKRYGDPEYWPITVTQEHVDSFGYAIYKVNEAAGNLITVARIQALFDAWKLRYIDGYDPEGEAALVTAKAAHYQTVVSSLSGLHGTVAAVDLTSLPQADQDVIQAALDSSQATLVDAVDEG